MFQVLIGRLVTILYFINIIHVCQFQVLIGRLVTNKRNDTTFPKWEYGVLSPYR